MLLSGSLLFPCIHSFSEFCSESYPPPPPVLQTLDGRSKEDKRSKFDTGIPDDLDVSVELKDWIFGLEGTKEIGVKFWQAAFRNLHVLGQSRSKTELSSTEKPSQKSPYPVECFTVQYTDNYHMYIFFLFFLVLHLILVSLCHIFRAPKTFHGAFRFISKVCRQ